MTVLERHVFPDINDMAIPDVNQGEAATLSDTAVMEWALDKRYMNGTQSMVIDLDSACAVMIVRACATTMETQDFAVRVKL